MMDAMRKGAKTWVAKVLLGLLAISFAMWGIADMFTGGTRGALATVGNQQVTAAEYTNAWNRYTQEYTRQTGKSLSLEEARQMGIDRAILNELIRMAAVDDESQKLGLAVSDTYLAKEVTENPAFRDSTGKFDKDSFLALLQRNGMNEAMYFAQQRQERVRDALMDTANGDLPGSKTMVEAYFRFANEQRDARYFTITTADSEVAAPTDEEIKAEYDANPAPYTAPEYRTIAIMKVEPADVMARIQISDADLQSSYERLKNDYFVPEKRTVLQLSFPTTDEAAAARKRIVEGMDFLALAQERGFKEADVTFADKVKTEFFDPAVAEAAFSLAEGAVSEPVKGSLATVLLKVVKIVPEHQSSFDEVKTQLSDRLKLEQARDEIESIERSVEDARGGENPKFETIAQTAGIPFMLFPAVDATGKDDKGAPADIPYKDAVLKAAFDGDMVGVDSAPIHLDEGYVWYEVRSVTPSALRPFDTVKDQARAAVLAGKIRALSAEKAQKLVERARSGTALDALATEVQAEVKTMQGLKRTEIQPGFDAAAVSAVFSVPEGGFASAVEADGRSAKIMQSQAVLLPSFDASTPEAQDIAKRLKDTATNDVLSAYLGALQKDVSVTINETLWRQVSGNTSQ